MQSCKAVQLPATSGCVVHSVLWKPATELLKRKKKSSGHFFKARMGTTALFLLRAVLLGGCWGLAAPGLLAAGAPCARLCVFLCVWARRWRDSVWAWWVGRGPAPRMLLGLLKHQRPGCSMDRSISVLWSACLFIPRLDDFSPLVFWPSISLWPDQEMTILLQRHGNLLPALHSCDSWPLCRVFRCPFRHRFSIPIVYLYWENLKEGLWVLVEKMIINCFSDLLVRKGGIWLIFHYGLTLATWTQWK